MIRCPWCFNLLDAAELAGFDHLCRFCFNYIDPAAVDSLVEQDSTKDDLESSGGEERE